MCSEGQNKFNQWLFDIRIVSLQTIKKYTGKRNENSITDDNIEQHRE
jgi:hypothetical protein